jgi:hypothetical protein
MITAIFIATLVLALIALLTVVTNLKNKNYLLEKEFDKLKVMYSDDKIAYETLLANSKTTHDQVLADLEKTLKDLNDQKEVNRVLANQIVPIPVVITKTKLKSKTKKKS